MDCPVCGAAAADAFKARHVRVAKCVGADCGHLFASDAAPHQGVEDHYDLDGPLAQFEARNARLIGMFVRRGALGANTRVLDFGAGAGHILRSLHAAHPAADITFIEANPDVAERVAAFGFRRADGLEGATGPYDLILAIEVIEHVDDPLAVLRALRERLAPNGRVFLTTPCGEDRRGNRDIPAAYVDPAHIHFFTETSLRRACREAGLDMTIESVPEMSPPDRMLVHQLKSLARMARDSAVGYHHLKGFATASAAAGDVAGEAPHAPNETIRKTA